MIVFTKGVARENQGGAVRGLGQSASEKSLSQNILSFYSSFHMGFFINFYHFLFIIFCNFSTFFNMFLFILWVLLPPTPCP